MNWTDLAAAVAKIGLPLLGAVLPIPGGAAIGSALASAIGAKSDNPADILATLTASADAVEKAKQFELTHQETMLKLTLDAQTASIQAVNKTLQTEAMGGSWLQKNHHALESLTFVGMMVGVYFVLPLLKVPVPTIPEFAYMAIAAVLGVTAWQRGAANVATAKAD